MAWELEVTMRVRRRLIVAGPGTHAEACEIVQGCLIGGMSPWTFAKRDRDGHPIEEILDNDFEVVCVERSDD